MTKRYRLTSRAQMHGEVRESGYVFTLDDGEVGPHRAVSAHPNTNIADHMNSDAPVLDEKLYVELSDEENAALDEAERKQTEEADAHAEVCQEHAAKAEEGAKPVAAPALIADQSLGNPNVT